MLTYLIPNCTIYSTFIIELEVQSCSLYENSNINKLDFFFLNLYVYIIINIKL